MPRLFIAIEMSEEVKSAFAGLPLELSGGRRVPADQVHLTLAFLGEQEEVLIDRLKEELAQVREEAFQLRFAGFGTFPRGSRPRVLWAGIEPEPRLDRLQRRVSEAVQRCHVALEDRPFSPHITLARFRQSHGDGAAGRRRDSLHYAVPVLPVHEFVLFQSRLTANGAIHTVLARFPLSVVP